MQTYSNEQLDAVCDLWVKHGLQPVQGKFFSYDAYHHLTGVCLLTIQALDAVAILPTEHWSLPQLFDALQQDLGLSQDACWHQADGFDEQGSPTVASDDHERFGRAVARRLRQRGQLS